MWRRKDEAEKEMPVAGEAWSTAWHFGACEPPPRWRGASEPDAVERAERTRCAVRGPKTGIPPERALADRQKRQKTSFCDAVQRVTEFFRILPAL